MSRWRTLALVAGAGALVLGSCAESPQSTGNGHVDSYAAMGHVHGLGVDPADDVLYAAAHFGLFRVEAGEAVRVADRWQDTMAFTVVGDGHFLASGHPDLRENLPAHLGLIESTDAGETWRPLALQGEADFHALEPAGDRLYGYDALSGAVMVSTDRRTFATIAELPAVDLAADPQDVERVLVTTPKGALVALDAATGRSRAVTAPRLVFLDWSAPDRLVGLGPDGTVQLSRDDAATWEALGKVPGEAAALEVADDAWYVATDRGLFTSSDAGQTWEALVAAAH